MPYVECLPPNEARTIDGFRGLLAAHPNARWVHRDEAVALLRAYDLVAEQREQREQSRQEAFDLVRQIVGDLARSLAEADRLRAETERLQAVMADAVDLLAGVKES